ncbi:MAG: response regulator transcription factor [Ectothiorhodospiraceae bacterium]|nr:response regulator transcription factor [Ectothiorhodospiraceae bacterium]
MNRQPILIVEDEPNIARLIEAYLKHAGFATIRAADGRRALDLIRDESPRLVILDLLLPEIDGWSVAHALRRESDIPFLILSAQKDEIDRVAGFTAGADDYVVKPFSPRELVERVRAIIRRYEAGSREGHPAVLRAGGLELDPERHRVSRGEDEIELTLIEFRLLQALMSAPGRVQTREALIARLYDDAPDVIDRVIDVHIGKLRRKLEHDPSLPRLIRTVRGVGYRFAPKDDER